MTDEQKIRIREYAAILNADITDGELIDFTISEVVDRVLVYLNDDTLDSKLERIVAKIVAGVFAQNKSSQNGSPEAAISSISDNGQTISYSSQIKNYLLTTEDAELFGGFSKLLAPYRRVNVASR